MAHAYQFYVAPANVMSGQLVIEGEEYHHIRHVLRKKTGDVIQAVDGRGSRYQGKIKKIEINRILVEITEAEYFSADTGLSITLVLAIPKGRRTDWILEKGTEIGVAAFQPILTDNCGVFSDIRLERWRQLAIAAMKQSGRFYCPEVKEIVNFSEALSTYHDKHCFIAHQDGEDAALFQSRFRLSPSTECVIFVGPEAGFSKAEIELALKNGAIPLNLGKYRLRSETAAFVAAIQMLNAAGDLGKNSAALKNQDSDAKG